MEAPLTVLIRVRRTTLPAVSRLLATWYVRTARRRFRSAARAASVAFGTLANAAFVGANTVSEPVDSVSASPAFLTRPTSVENCGSDAATCTIVRCEWAPAGAATGTATTVPSASASRMRFMYGLLVGCVTCGTSRGEEGLERPRAGLARGGRRQRRARLRSGANRAQGRVFATSAAVSQARRAVATPQRVSGSVL